MHSCLEDLFLLTSVLCFFANFVILCLILALKIVPFQIAFFSISGLSFRIDDIATRVHVDAEIDQIIAMSSLCLGKDQNMKNRERNIKSERCSASPPLFIKNGQFSDTGMRERQEVREEKEREKQKGKGGEGVKV